MTLARKHFDKPYRRKVVQLEESVHLVQSSGWSLKQAAQTVYAKL